MKRVTGIGGIFFKTKDAKKLNEWYAMHLGFKQADDEAILFEWRNTDAPEEKNYTVWAPFKESTKYFEPSSKEYMINFRVENLEALMEGLKEEGVQIIGEIEKYEYGKFG
jgi:catechol 2,3-dioxygenase-like lactoylglutathione lyase family enzyme